MPAPGAAFEMGFMAHSLEQQVSFCDHYELAKYFEKHLPGSSPILEAGCGSGRWVGWFDSKGWQATGLDWSEACCERASKAFPNARFNTGDMRDMPYEDGAFGAIVSLGAVEHSPEGPGPSLREFHRVLGPGGIAIITVPYLGLAKRIHHIITIPVKAIKFNPQMRKRMGKSWKGTSMAEARRKTMPGHVADFLFTETGCEFYQYYFTKAQMRSFLQEANLDILEEFIEFGDEGIIHNFGVLTGRYDYNRGVVSLTWLGRLLRAIIPVGFMGLMLCHLVRKKAEQEDVPPIVES
jgi:SAM-dependent methyltransferase